MRIEQWEPIYRAILDEFGYDREDDDLARDRLAALVDHHPRDASEVRDFLGGVVDGGTVAIAGGAPRLEDDHQVAEAADAVVAASDAGARLDAVGVEPDLVVTDLDGAPDRTVELARRGVPVAVHAHGDNVAALEQYVPELPSSRVLPTTQSVPPEPLWNPGGFTDGDRAAFVAHHLGADRLCFPGWDLDDPTLATTKRRKLRWAEWLLHWLERERSEQFDLLDGRRDRIDLDAFPG